MFFACSLEPSTSSRAFPQFHILLTHAPHTKVDRERTIYVYLIKRKSLSFSWANGTWLCVLDGIFWNTFHLPDEALSQ